MKKKLLGIASLLCTATLCAGVGVAALGTEADTVVTAATPVYTKTVNGVEYTFEQDFNNLTYTGLGDITNNNGVKTSVGATVYAHGNDAGDTYITKHMIKSADNTSFLSTSNGVEFQFKTTGAWKQGNRMEFAFGDLVVYLSSHYQSSGKNRLNVTATTYLSGGTTKADISWTKNNNGAKSYCFWNNFFDFEDPSNTGSNYIMKDGWATVKVHKNKCTSTTGYWLTLSVQAPGATSPIVIHNGYLNNSMYSDTYDGVGLGFAPGVNTTFVKVRNCTPTLTVNKETSTDIADWGTTDEEYLKGVERTAVSYRDNSNMVANKLSSQLSRGIEFRMTETTAITTAEDSFVCVRMGSNLLDIYPSTDLKTWNMRLLYNTNANYNPTNANVNAWVQELYQKDVLACEFGAEYAVKAMRLAVNPSANNGVTGSIVRVYMAKVNPETGLPAEGWDKTPVFEHFSAVHRVTNNASENNWGVKCASDGSATHTTFIRSNKYVGVKTEVAGNEVLHKVPYGTDFALADLVTGENTVLVGWSKGADNYSAEDFLAANTVFEDMKESKLDNVYHALTIEIEAAKAASLRLRKRTDNPLEISLNWKAQVTDANSLGEYFGGIAFGYKLMAKNAEGQVASTEQQVNKVTDGYTTPYAYSVTQSNIDDYALKFVCQAYVEFEIGGEKVKFYSEAPDLDQDGRSVEYVRAAVLADVKDEVTGEYKTAVEVDGVTKYTYLTAWQYDFIKAYIA